MNIGIIKYMFNNAGEEDYLKFKTVYSLSAWGTNNAIEVEYTNTSSLLDELDNYMRKLKLELL